MLKRKSKRPERQKLVRRGPGKVRVRAVYRKPIDEKKLAMAIIMLAQSIVKEERRQRPRDRG